MQIESDLKLDFKDVLIKPKRSTLKSRSDVNLIRKFEFKYSTHQMNLIPIIAANMDTIGTYAMANELIKHNMATALHKHYDADSLISFFNQKTCINSFYSIGTTQDDLDKFNLVKLKSDNLIKRVVIDVANGYSEGFVDFIKRFRDDNRRTVIMAGNVVTGEMTEELILSGVDIVKIGIGPGACCTTRIKTGVGYPQLSAVMECADSAHGLDGHICSDGGCTVPGDIAKAFGAGADFVMLGGMLSGHVECDGDVYSRKSGRKVTKNNELFHLNNDYYMSFYGMSSETAMKKYSGGVAEYRASEGKTVQVPFKGPVEYTVRDILGGLRSTCTYVGARKLKELSKRTTFIRVTQQENTIFS